MILTISLEARFYKTKEGRFYTDNNFTLDFWKRYLLVFPKIRVVARVQNIDNLTEKMKEIDTSDISIISLPYYIGPLGYLKNFFKTRKILKSLTSTKSAYIMRVSSPIGDILGSILRKKNISYGIEVVGDPWDVFSKGVFNHPLRVFFKYYFTYNLKKLAKNAIAGSYVTQEILQKRYPVKKNGLTIGASSISLKDEDILKKTRKYTESKKDFTFITIGSLEYMVKGTDLLVKAFKKIQDENPKYNLKLKVLGKGRCKKEILKICEDLNILDQVSFTDSLPGGAAVQSFIDSGDIFILPSRSEGLPRVIIEAMARALPCLGSSAGGIVELLNKEQRAKVNSFEDLARVMNLHLKDPDKLNELSLYGLNKSREYHTDILTERRTRFYSYLKDNV